MCLLCIRCYIKIVSPATLREASHGRSARKVAEDRGGSGLGCRDLATASSATADHAEEFIAELATLVRRLKTLILIVCLSIPVFLVATISVLWHALTQLLRQARRSAFSPAFDHPS